MTGRAESVAPGVRGLAGFAVLIVMLQSSGGFGVELLGPDLVLAVAGYVVTVSVLDTLDGGARLSSWYRDRIGRHAPLYVLVLLFLLGAVALLGGPHQAGQAAVDALASFGGVQNELQVARAGALPFVDPALLAPFGDWYATRAGVAPPFGAFWLISLLVQVTLIWPLVLVALRRLLRVGTGRRLLTVLLPVVLVLAAGVWAYGFLRAQQGAGAVELAFGSHVRASEWLHGAAAGVVAAAQTPVRRLAPVAGALGIIVILATAAAATVARDPWLAVVGPTAGAAGAALLLLAASGDGPVASVLGRGLPLELGRSAYPLLLLHLPLYWLLQLAVPTIAPFAMIVIGGGLAWLVGLLVQDGILGRRRERPRPTVLGVMLGVVGVVLVPAAAAVLFAAAYLPLGTATGPTVLVVGGSGAGDLAVALDRTRYAVVDLSRPGCGLLPEAPATGSAARPTALAQAPAPAPVCAATLDRWSGDVLRTRPVAVVVDLSDDASARRPGSRLPGPCDAAFRPLYRTLMASAVATLDGHEPARPVLFVGVRDPGRYGGCLDGLVAEAATSYPSAVRLAPGEELAPALTAALGAEATAARVARSGADCTASSGDHDDHC